MFRNGTTTALILSSVLATGCWTDDVAHGYLAVEFEDGEVLTRPIVIPPAEEGEYRLYYALESRGKVCVLRGAELHIEHACESPGFIKRPSTLHGRKVDVFFLVGGS